jgi:hypothetical protein
VPPEQVSPVVHALPSLQLAVLLVWTQPLAPLHESSVQPLPSSQFGGGPPWHVPPEQVSPVVHALPSLQLAVLGMCTQPLAGLHESSVQPLPSSQFGAGPPWHVPPEQVSPVVQGLPSLQLAVLGVCTQPVDGLQLSVVHGLLSSHEMAALEQEPPEHVPSVTWHMSVAVHALPSAFWQLPEALQALQAPQALEVQQNPSVQEAFATHSSLVEQWAPSGFLPQVLPTQLLGGTQSLFDVQVTRHADAPSHMKGEHICVPPPTLQLPAPSHVLASVPEDAPPGHAGGTHCVPACHLWHAPAPSHLPSLPQVEAAVTPHWPLGSVAFAATGEHVPSVALSVHETQGPSQRALQQTPCFEHTRPDEHWLLAVHGPPFGSRPQEPLMQVALGAQSALAVQVALQTAAPHAKGKHDVEVGVTHLPAPSQVDWLVKVVVAAGQVGSLHFVPAA